MSSWNNRTKVLRITKEERDQIQSVFTANDPHIMLMIIRSATADAVICDGEIVKARRA